MNQQSTFFIIGIARSGTTLLEKILDNHSQLGVCPESNMFKLLKRVGAEKDFASAWHYRYFIQAVMERLKKFNDPALAVVSTFLNENPEFSGSSLSLLKELSGRYKIAKQKNIIGEKSPENLFELPTMLTVCPSAYFIYIIRHPFDVICSLSNLIALGKADELYTDELIMQAAMIVKRGINTLFSKFSNSIAKKTLIKYEDLVLNPHSEIAKVCQFLNIPFEAGMIHYDARNYFHPFENAQAIVHPNLTKTINNRSIDRYLKHLNPRQVELLKLFLSKELTLVSYSLPEDRLRLNAGQYALLLKYRLLYFLRSYLWKDEYVRQKIKLKYFLFLLKNCLSLKHGHHKP